MYYAMLHVLNIGLTAKSVIHRIYEYTIVELASTISVNMLKYRMGWGRRCNGQPMMGL